MKLTATVVNHTPVFLLPTARVGAWSTVWGASARAADHIFPGYFPFGLLSVQGLDRIPGLELDALAEAQWERLKNAEALCLASEKARETDRFSDLPLPNGYRFHRTPFKHQTYGVAQGYARYRKHYLWDMGTGKTGTVAELLRLLRAHAQFTRAIIMCPPVVMPTWEREVRKVTDGELTVCLWDPDEVGTKEVRAAGWVKGENSRREFAQRVIQERANNADIVVVSYSMSVLEARLAKKQGKQSPLLDLSYDVIVGDESQCIGDYRSGQTEAALNLSARAGRRILLSGTAADHPNKLYPQLKFLAPGLVPRSYWDYRSRYVEEHPTIAHMVIGYRNLSELNERVDMVATRMKKDECLDLPPRTTTDVPFRLGTKQAKRYNQLVEELRASAGLFLQRPARVKLTVLTPEMEEAIEEGAYIPAVRHEDQSFIEHAKGGVRVSKLRQCLSGFLLPSQDLSICDKCEHMIHCVNLQVRPYTPGCHVVKKPVNQEPVRDFENPRLDVFKALLSNILESDDSNKVIVWANFRLELDDIEAVCKAEKVGYVRLDGSTSKHIRSFEDRFESDPSCRVWAAQSATGVGITLNAANYTIDYAPTWDRVHDKQKRDRNYRAGQTRAVTEYRLYAENTLDEFILSTLRFKDTVAFTMLEKIACAGCEHQRRCAEEENRPFSDGCVHHDDIDKPRSVVDSVSD